MLGKIHCVQSKPQKRRYRPACCCFFVHKNGFGTRYLPCNQVQCILEDANTTTFVHIMYLVTFLFQGQLLGGWFEAALFVVGVAVVVLQLWQGAGSRSSAKETALGLVEKDRDDMIGKCTVSTRGEWVKTSASLLCPSLLTPNHGHEWFTHLCLNDSERQGST